MSDKIMVSFVFEKETKGTYRFQEVEEPGKPPKVGTLYLKKYMFPTTRPQELTIEISVTK